MRREQGVLVHLRGAALRAGDERGAQLRRLRAEREHRGDAGAVHDAAGGNDRHFDRVTIEPGEGKRAGERVIWVAQRKCRDGRRPRRPAQ